MSRISAAGLADRTDAHGCHITALAELLGSAARDCGLDFKGPDAALEAYRRAHDLSTDEAAALAWFQENYSAVAAVLAEGRWSLETLGETEELLNDYLLELAEEQKRG